MKRLESVKIQLTDNINFDEFQEFMQPYIESGQFEWIRSGNSAGRWILCISKVPKELFKWKEDFIFVPTVQGKYNATGLYYNDIPINKDNYKLIANWEDITITPPQIEEEEA